MTTSLNKVMLIGNLGRDPEIRTTPNGTKLANLSVATSESWLDKASGERKERTEWHRVSVFGGVVEVIEKYLSKGGRVYVEGMLQTRKYTDNSGQDRYSTEVLIGKSGKIVLLDRAPEKEKRTVADEIGDEIPF